ncbi:MAG: hypothetical protein LBU32_11060 [Clostridiales bacterium]|nr:hypothetical protein [Clostridiales bacterium]
MRKDRLDVIPAAGIAAAVGIPEASTGIPAVRTEAAVPAGTPVSRVGFCN